MVWSQLQHGQKPLVTEPQVGGDKPRASVHPPGPHVNGRVLAPPPAWLKQQAAGSVGTSAAANAQTKSKQNVSENSNQVTPQKPTVVSMCQFIVVVVAVK